MRRRLNRITAFALLGMCLTAIVPQGVALCLAADGHMAVELSHGEEACTTDQQRHHDGEELSVEHEGHGCRDIFLSSGSDTVAPARKAALASSDHAVALPPAT
ncbi:MAG: hypothetical protein ACI8TX_003910, partial [Hyphomicrobiaceae bacterium]